MSIRPFMLASGLALASVVPFVSRPAAACTCAINTLISPPANAADVPINAVIVFESPAPPTVFDETHGAAVEVTAELFNGVARTWIVRANGTWASNSTFKVTDSSFPTAASSHFSTGATVDELAPVYDGITSLRVDATPVGASPPCRSSCWISDTLRAMHFEYAPPPADATMLLLEVRRAGGAAITATLPLSRGFSGDWPKDIYAGSCIRGMPEFEPGEEVCARIVALDLAGHGSAPSPEICSTAISCPLVFSQFCSLPADCSQRSDPNDTNDAGPDTAEPDADPIDAVRDVVGADATEVDTPTPPTHEPDAGGPVTPPGDGGCSVSRHDPASSSARPLFAALLVAASFMRRRRRTVSG